MCLQPYEQLVAAEDPTEAREGHADESGFQQRPSFGGNYVLQLTGRSSSKWLMTKAQQ